MAYRGVTGGTAQFHMLSTGGDAFLNFGTQDTGQPGLTPKNGNALVNASDTFSFIVEVTIEGLSSGALISSTETLNQTIRAVYEVSASTANSSFASSGLEIVDYDNKIIDTHNAVTVGASWVFTAPRTGSYLVTANLLWSDNTNMTEELMEIFTNAAIDQEIIRLTNQEGMGGTAIIDLVAGDAVDLRARQIDSGAGARTILTSASISRISIASLPDFTNFASFSDGHHAGNLEISGQAYSPTNTLTDQANIATDCDLGNVHAVTLTDNRTLDDPTNMKDGATYIWRITQDGGGTNTLAYGSAFLFEGGTTPVLSTGGGEVDILSGVSDGTSIFASLAKDFS